MNIPSIGRIVWYRSRTDAYTVPAIITTTVETLYEPAVEAGYIPGLFSPTHVHLTVFSPGIPVVGPNVPLGTEKPDTMGLPTGASSYNLAGTYQEWNVPFFDPSAYGDNAVPVSCAPKPTTDELVQLPGTWAWPEIRR